MIFYDFETVICEDPKKLTVENAEQYPNMVCFDAICHICFVSGEESCCPVGHFSYKNTSTDHWAVTDAFVDFILYDRRNDGAIVVAHNSGGFDLHFILKRLLARNIFPSVIKHGNRIIKMTLKAGEKSNYLEFKDSYALIHAPLSDLPKAFNIPNIMKGDFPFLFNKPCNYGSNLPHLPDLKYYNINQRNIKKKEAFEKYWLENYNTPFDFDAELLKYCADDVRILRQAVVAYMKSNLDLTGWNPFIVSNTFAGFTLHIIAFNYLKPKTLGVVHENGVFSNQKQSKLALQYIQWLEEVEGVKYQHFLNQGEFEVQTSIGRMRVDAYREGVAVEVMGCAIHSCPKCFDPAAKHFLEKRTNNEVFEKSMARINALERTGLKVVIIWEHEIKEMLSKNKEMKKFFKNCIRTHRLQPRDAFLGGRTQVYKMFHKVADDEKYERLDVNSLYPFITGFFAEFPLGSPEIMVKDLDRDITTVHNGRPFPYKGLVMLEVLPPKNLPFPILGTKIDKKLLFTLCRTCAIKKKNLEECSHTDDERKIFLTTTHVELNLALQHGYRILKIYEVWNWDRWEKGGLFADFVKQFYKIKQESSGWPSPNMTDAEKYDYLETIRRETGVELNRENIEVNNAKKTCAKLMLNSSWGKFGVNINMPTTVFVKEGSDQMMNIIESPKEFTLNSLKIVIDDVVCIGYTPKETFATQPRFTNIVIALFTTAYARNYHWNFLHEIQKTIGRKAITYVDTDCIHYVCKKNQHLLSEWRGNVLGKLVDETPTGWRVTRFVSAAPKTYGLELKDQHGNTDYIIKCKGVTIDADASMKVNFESLKDQVFDFVKGEEVDPIITTRSMIRKNLGTITTKTMEKRTQPVMDKVQYLEDYTTIPYGYDMQHDAG